MWLSTRLCVGAVALLFSISLVRAETETPREIEGGVLDWIRIHVAAIPEKVPIFVHEFDATEADLGTGAPGGKPKHVEAARAMQRDAPALLAGEMVSAIEESGHFPDVRLATDGALLPEDALVIEGRFTVLNPGSQAKRYWVGFGAGKGSWTIRSTVKDASGKILAEFEQERITTMGLFGGKAVKKFRKDCERLGKDVARFLVAWATGEDLGKS